jgi:hypothetical protein|tara:strand:+ start:946 stop:1158 length:213 start_codon:yes stop_codon:yes gene_type:complete
MGDSIDPVMATPTVVSSYTRVYPVGDRVIMSTVEHVNDRGSTTVEEVKYVGYGADGKMNDNASGKVDEIV